MGLINKIEDKLSGSNSNKLEKQGDYSTPTTGTTSQYQNPSSTGQTSDYSTGDSSTTTSSNVPSSYPQSTGGYTSTTSDRMPGTFVNDESHVPASTSSASANTPSKPFDPYSRSGQQTAANTEPTGYGSTSTRDYSRTSAEDPSVARSKDGGIMNQTTTAPTSTGASDSSPSYGRDATIAGTTGAVGAGGVGAYEYGKQPSAPASQQQTAAGTATGTTQDVSYMNKSSPSAMQGSTTTAGTTTSAPSGEAPGLEQAKKMGGAYEAGYRDGMEHMKQEMLAKQGSTGL